MQNSPEFVGYLVDLLAPFGNTRAKRMFGGYGCCLANLVALNCAL